MQAVDRRRAPRYSRAQSGDNMKGIQFVIDADGNKRAVQIDLDTWGELWEDFFDAALAGERAEEPEEEWHVVRERLNTPDKISE